MTEQQGNDVIDRLNSIIDQLETVQDSLDSLNTPPALPSDSYYSVSTSGGDVDLQIVHSVTTGDLLVSAMLFFVVLVSFLRSSFNIFRGVRA